MEYKNNRIYLETSEIKKPKKITGTRFPAVLGLSKYSTPFQAWCEIMHVYEPPMEENEYTRAGKAVEPKQAEYVKQTITENLVFPKDIFGENYLYKTKGNFFKDDIFGGMWDYLEQDNNETKCVFEMKTAGKSKRTEWKADKIPEYYALQAALYAWLLHTDNVTMVTTFLDKTAGDYINPDSVVVTEDNTIIKNFKISERYPNFKNDYADKAVQWWKDYVESGVSPECSCTDDMEIVAKLRLLDSSKKDDECIAELDKLMDEIQNDIIAKSSIDFAALQKKYLDLSFVLYTVSGVAAESGSNVAIAKVDAAKILLESMGILLQKSDPAMLKKILND